MFRITFSTPRSLIGLLAVLLVAVLRLQEVQGLASPSTTMAPQSTVVYGPQSRELLLLVAKLAAHQGLTAHCICAPGTEDGCRRLMYGTDYADAGLDAKGNAVPISDPEAMSSALAGAESLVLVATDEPVDGATLETFLKYTTPELLQKIVLVSKMGVTRSGGGGFFGGGGNAQLWASEQDLAQIAKDRHLDFSIVRAGLLKGGGPAVDKDQGLPLHEETALNKAYYTTILDVVDYKVTLAHDTFSLGADATSVVLGDPHSMPNVVTQLGTKASFEPGPTDTNRIVVAAAAVAALSQPSSLEISVGTAAGQELPTPAEWATLLESIQQPSAVA